MLIVAVILVLAGWFAYRSRDSIDLSLWRDRLVWPWALAAAVGALASLAGATWNLIGASPVRLRFGRTMAAQLAGTLARLVSPTAVGGAAVNVVYLRRAGLGKVPAVGAVSVAQALQLVTTMALLPVLGMVGGNRPVPLPGGGPLLWWVLGGVAVASAVLGLAVRLSPRVRSRIVTMARELAGTLRATLADPRAAAVSVAGSVLLSAGLVVALWAAVHAFGGHLGLVAATFALLVGSTVGNAVPVPAGLGSVDAALVATLGASGVSLGVALPAVLLFRLVTLWLQVPVAVVCAAALRRRRAL